MAEQQPLSSGRIPDPQPEHTPLFRWLARVFQAVETKLRARGGRGLRSGIRVFWALIAATGVFLLVGPVLNQPLDFDDVLDAAEIDEVDWIATDVAIDYEVGRDEEDRFAAEAEERFTANFTNGPEATIERAFVTEFRGHDARFELHEATIDGEPADVDVRRGAATTRVTIERPDGADFDGQHEVVLSYEFHDLVTTVEDEATGADIDQWGWPLLGPAWPQATKGIEVSLTLSPKIDEALVRPPRAYVGWLLVSGTSWLEAESTTSEGVRYAFSNDDTLPPHPDLDLTVSFASGTFAQPPTTPLFWVQTWGPLIPLALLAVFTLFSFVARRVVWADSAGRPWYVAREEPPADLSPDAAARLMGRPRHAELVDALATAPTVRARADGKRRKWGKRRAAHVRPSPLTHRARERWFRAVARAGMRAGRWGNFPSVVRRRLAWARHDLPVERGLRWVPDSYLRDSFIWGSLALVLLQWGLLRQLSHQVILTVVWWPALFVLGSTLLAMLVCWAVRRPRPLTPEGALAMQELKGIDAWATTTRLRDRGPVDDALLPYAVLFEGPRRAGRRMAQLAGRETGDAKPGRGWRTEHFVSAPALLALAAAIAVLAGAIVTVSVRPAPYGEAEFVTEYHRDIPALTFSQVEGFEVDAELVREKDGTARIDVVEHTQVRFTPSGGRVPQFGREWPRERLGQDLGLDVGDVTVDGDPVPTQQVEGPQTTAIVTQLPEVLDGVHEVEVEYSLTSPVVDAPGDAGASQQLRWTAWLGFWEDTYYTNIDNAFDGTAPVRPLRVSLEIAPDLAGEVASGGWIDTDVDLPRVPYEDGNTFKPWVGESRVYDDSERSYELRIGSEQRASDGTVTVTIDADAVESREIDRETQEPTGPFVVDAEVNAWLEEYELDLSDDLGVVLNFPAATFESVEQGAYNRYETSYWLPYTATLVLGGTVTLAAAAAILLVTRTRRSSRASVASIALWAVPLAAIGQSVLCWWVVGPMPGGNAAGAWALWLGALMWAAVGAEFVLVARRLRRSGTDAADFPKNARD